MAKKSAVIKKQPAKNMKVKVKAAPSNKMKKSTPKAKRGGSMC